MLLIEMNVAHLPHFFCDFPWFPTYQQGLIVSSPELSRPENSSHIVLRWWTSQAARASRFDRPRLGRPFNHTAEFHLVFWFNVGFTQCCHKQLPFCHPLKVSILGMVYGIRFTTLAIILDCFRILKHLAQVVDLLSSAIQMLCRSAGMLIEGSRMWVLLMISSPDNAYICPWFFLFMDSHILVILCI
jgi:hypothetical protein